ncbi:MAG: hypothetical protein ABIR27_05380, partial [Dokdonella sp.]
MEKSRCLNLGFRKSSSSRGFPIAIVAALLSLKVAIAAEIPLVPQVSIVVPGYMPNSRVMDMPSVDFDGDGRPDIGMLAQLEYSDLIQIMGYDQSGEWTTKQAIAPDAGNYEFSPAQLS